MGDRCVDEIEREKIHKQKILSYKSASYTARLVATSE